MADDGGSTGVLRDELGVLPPGDVRQCLVALSDSSETLRELMNSGALHPYPVLRDTGKGMVSQFEHTVIVEHDSAKATTKV